MEAGTIPLASELIALLETTNAEVTGTGGGDEVEVVHFLTAEVVEEAVIEVVLRAIALPGCGSLSAFAA